MQISLKQSEIVSAIRGYIETQGINLSGKNVDISFTSGRKGNGLTADVDIYVGEKEVEEVVTEDIPVADACEATQEAPAEPQAESQAESPADTVVGVSSLFG